MKVIIYLKKSQRALFRLFFIQNNTCYFFSRDAITRTTEIVNAMGEASARAQGLTKPITTAERLRNSEQQRLYLLVDRDARK